MGPLYICIRERQLESWGGTRGPSAAKNALVVPAEKNCLGVRENGRRDGDPRSVEGVISPTILEVAAQSLAHFEAQAWRHGHIAQIEQAMQVRTKKESVADLVHTALSVRLDVGGLEDGQ